MHALTIEARHRANGTGSLAVSEGPYTARVKVDTLLDVAWADAATADSRTGRHVRTSHATLAKAVGCSPRTARRCRQLIEQMGYARTVQRGRYLTNDEREAAYRTTGRWQLRMASDRALVMPPLLAQREVKGHLPQRGSLNPSLTSASTHLARDTRAGSGSRRSLKTSSNKNREPRPRPNIATQRLAAQLVRSLPNLAPEIAADQTHRAGHHIGQVCQVLICVGVDPDEWTAVDLEEAMNRQNRETHRDSLHHSQQRNPMGFLAHQLRAVLAATPEGPALGRRRAAEAHQARREAERAAQAKHDAQVEHDRATGRIARRVAEARAAARAVRQAALADERQSKHSPVVLSPSPCAARNR